MITIGVAKGFSTKERWKLDQVVRECNHLLKSRELKDAVLAHETVDGQLKYKGFYGTEDTSLIVYKALASIETPVTIYLQTPPWYKRLWTSELARENSDGSITINRDYFNKSGNLPALVGTLLHELCHRAGYSHSYGRTRMRNYSVPYAVGIIAEKLAFGAVTLLPEFQQTPETV